MLTTPGAVTTRGVDTPVRQHQALPFPPAHATCVHHLPPASCYLPYRRATYNSTRAFLPGLCATHHICRTLARPRPFYDPLVYLYRYLPSVLHTHLPTSTTLSHTAFTTLWLGVKLQLARAAPTPVLRHLPPYPTRNSYAIRLGSPTTGNIASTRTWRFHSVVFQVCRHYRALRVRAYTSCAHTTRLPQHDASGIRASRAAYRADHTTLRALPTGACGEARPRFHQDGLPAFTHTFTARTRCCAVVTFAAHDHWLSICDAAGAAPGSRGAGRDDCPLRALFAHRAAGRLRFLSRSF